jgi:hypothetical protein
MRERRVAHAKGWLVSLRRSRLASGGSSKSVVTALKNRGIMMSQQAAEAHDLSAAGSP